LENDLQAELKGWVSVCGAHDFPQVAQARKDLLLATADEHVAAGNSPGKWEELENDFSLTDHLGEITLPTLLLYGKYDMSVPPGYWAICLQWPGSNRKVVGEL
jgi:pimeloyl-ACP methyl ester carboxylesterase